MRSNEDIKRKYMSVLILNILTSQLSSVNKEYPLQQIITLIYCENEWFGSGLAADSLMGLSRGRDPLAGYSNRRSFTPGRTRLKYRSFICSGE
jgi:hypothetical protein